MCCALCCSTDCNVLCCEQIEGRQQLFLAESAKAGSEETEAQGRQEVAQGHTALLIHSALLKHDGGHVFISSVRLSLSTYRSQTASPICFLVI